jgi:hypothetical protein
MRILRNNNPSKLVRQGFISFPYPFNHNFGNLFSPSAPIALNLSET